LNKERGAVSLVSSIVVGSVDNLLRSVTASDS
jgi:hypothetical protein